MAVKEKGSNILSTRNYRLFKISEENRALNLGRHRKLRESMERYGFLRSFPIVCTRDNDQKLVLEDGQHRLAFAEDLGLVVHYVVEKVAFDIAKINCTSKSWTAIDYAQKYAAEGNVHYQDTMKYADRTGLPIGMAFAIMGGKSTFSGVKNDFEDGEFTIDDREWAETVASCYTGVVHISADVKNARFLEACMAACRVEGFSVDRFYQGAKRRREKLVSYNTRDAYLDMIEDIYNFGRNSNNIEPIKFEALKAMRQRNPATKKNK